MIELRAVTAHYGDGPPAVDNVTFRVEEGTTLALVGPSGCGKTTTLKLINRLVEPTSGTILVDDTDISQLDAAELRRGIGYVVQEAGLFPHMTAAENVEVVPRLIGWSGRRRRQRVGELFGMVGLDYAEFGERFPSQLSGGQRQRVGLARALAANPGLVLMDEPFGALDPISRRHLQDQFLELKVRLTKTMVIVTHDMDEAFRLGDRVALLQDGRIAQLGTPSEICARPASDFVSQMVGFAGEERPSAPHGREDDRSGKMAATSTRQAARIPSPPAPAPTRCPSLRKYPSGAHLGEKRRERCSRTIALGSDGQCRD